jgi:potassium-transporting ATPase KdpC subunit
MKRELMIAIRMTVVTLVLTGFIYPCVMTGVAQALFPHQAGGSIVSAGGREVGSELIGQTFSGAKYFHGRPSAAGNGYDATASTGSNLGPTSKKLHDRVAADAESLQAENPLAPGPVPVELVTASGSGLDPHVSVAAALWQAPRVAQARGVPLTSIESLIRQHVERRTFGFLGEPRVNVLLVNLALDR